LLTFGETLLKYAPYKFWWSGRERSRGAAGFGDTTDIEEVTDVRVKKLVLVLAALALIAALAACGGPEDSANAPAAPEQEETRAEPSGDEPQEETPAAEVPEDTTLKLTVPKMANIKDDNVPYTTGDDEEALHDNAGIHLDGTGHPWEEEANIYIAGHRLGYPNTDSFLAFWDLDALENGDEVILTDANGKKYTYEVFKEFVVAPTDLYVTEPIEGKNVVTLQTCTLPDYAERLIVQAELKS
jgi:sortase A